MENKYNDIKDLIYEGVNIYSEIKNCKLEIEQCKLSIEDKKYLALYLGILNTNNIISKTLKKYNCTYNIQVNCRNLDKQNFSNIFNNYFIEIFNNNSFETIYDYFYYLLEQEVVKKFNYVNNVSINKIFKEKNKKLIKQIK